jgi:predicted ATPase
VLIEQPELHLHPAMQLKLADFLLACSRTGRQIVIETHSEHVINRLRLRVVADETSATAELVRLLFAEQENGETLYRISDINEVGGLSTDWPKGFLDVAADESTRLRQHSLAKKRVQAEKKS